MVGHGRPWKVRGSWKARVEDLLAVVRVGLAHGGLGLQLGRRLLIMLDEAALGLRGLAALLPRRLLQRRAAQGVPAQMRRAEECEDEV